MKTIEKTGEYSLTQSFADDLVRISLDIGEGLLKSGAEIHRVETTIEKICRAYDAKHVEVFSIQSLIIVSVRMPDGTYSSQTRRINDISNHMLCLENYNSLSRYICENTPHFDVVDKKIRDIKSKRKYPLSLSVLGHILAAGGFAILFGGSWRDSAAAALIGLLIALLDRLNIIHFNKLTKTLFLAFSAGILTCLTVIAGIGENMDIIAIGTIMLLIPGLALGNAMIDLLYGDTLTGTLKTVQACITAVMIAIGYALAIIFLGAFCPQASPVSGNGIGYIALLLLSSAVGTLGFSLIFKSEYKRLFISALGGLMTYAVFEIFSRLGAGVLIAAFCASLFMSIFSEGCAKLFRAPAIVFLFPCAIPIVPGGSLYYSMYNLLVYNGEKFTYHLQSTAHILLGMTLGICLSSVILGIFRHIISKAKKL